MKIIQVLSTVAGGGAEVFATELSLELVKIPGTEVNFLTYHSIFDSKGQVLKERLENAGIDYIKVGQGKGIMKFLAPLLGFRKQIESLKPDVLHVHHLAPAILIAFLKALGFIKCEVVLTLHNAIKLPQIPRKLVPFFFKQFSCIVGCSDFVKQNYVYKPILDQIVSIPNGINLERIKNNENGHKKAEWKAKIGLKPNDICFINVGSMIYLEQKNDTIKGHRLMIDAMEQLARTDKYGNIKIIFLGGGDFQNDIAREVEERKLSNYIILPGLTPDPFPFIFASDFALMPSYSEGLSIALTECTCAGLPAIVSPHLSFTPFLCSSVSAIADWNAKLIFDKMEDMISRRLEVTSEANVNKAIFLEKFDIAHVATKYLQLYRSMETVPIL